MRTWVTALWVVSLAATGCQHRTTTASQPVAVAARTAGEDIPAPPLDRLFFTQSVAGAANGSPEVPIAEAVKGVPGPAKGQLTAKLTIAGSGVDGTITCELYEAKAPKTVANFVSLARGLRAWRDPKTGQWVKRPFYDGTIFHRVIPEFMVQGGDPKGNGTGDPGYMFDDEIVADLALDKPGILAMANRGRTPDGRGTNGSQFFITEKDTRWLTGRHTVFGLCDNVALVRKMTHVPTGPANRPNSEIVLKKVVVQRVAVRAKH